jgi:hypothetical protein
MDPEDARVKLREKDDLIDFLLLRMTDRKQGPRWTGTSGDAILEATWNANLSIPEHREPHDVADLMACIRMVNRMPPPWREHAEKILQSVTETFYFKEISRAREAAISQSNEYAERLDRVRSVLTEWTQKSDDTETNWRLRIWDVVGR